MLARLSGARPTVLHPATAGRASQYQATQGIHYDSLKAGAFLTEEELDVLRWGHSAKVTVPKRFSPNGAHTDTYRKSTAMECLVRISVQSDTHKRCCDVMVTTSLGFKADPVQVAYLYLTSPSRLHQLMVELRLA